MQVIEILFVHIPAIDPAAGTCVTHLPTSRVHDVHHSLRKLPTWMTQVDTIIRTHASHTVASCTNTCAHIHTYMHGYMNTHTFLYTTNKQTCAYKLCTCKNTKRSLHTRTHTHAHMYTLILALTCTLVCMCTHTHTHTHTHTLFPPRSIHHVQCSRICLLLPLGDSLRWAQLVLMVGSSPLQSWITSVQLLMPCAGGLDQVTPALKYLA